MSGMTFIRYAKYRNIGKPNNLNVFESNTTKGSKQESQNVRFVFTSSCWQESSYLIYVIGVCLRIR